MKSGVYIFAVFYLSFFVSIPLALSWNNDDVSDKINNSTTPNDIESMVSYGEGGQIQVMSDSTIESGLMPPEVQMTGSVGGNAHMGKQSIIETN